MKKYQLPKEGFENVKKQLRKWTVGLMSFMYIIALAMLAYHTGLDVKSLLIMVSIIGISSFFGLRRGMKRQEEAWNSYELIIKENEIIQTQDNRRTIIIDKAEIKEIITKKGAFVIKTADSFRTISIPKEIEDYEEIKELLNEIAPIKEQTEKFLLYKIFGFVLGILTLMFVFFTSQEQTTSLITGSLIIGLVTWSTFVIQKGYVDKRLKRNSWLIIIVILAVLGKLYYQLF